MATVSAGGATFDISQVGRGRDLVLFHSLLTDRTVFDPVVPALADDHRLTLVNLPGFGGSSAPLGPTIEDYADQVAALFPVLGLDSAETDVLGMSFGGFVAIALAARHGHLFRRLVLVDTAAAFPEPARVPLRAMAEQAASEGMAAVVHTALRRMFSESFIAGHPEVVAERRRVLLAARPEYFAMACRALASVDLRAALAAIHHPTLVVVGALDTTTPPALARELAAGIAGARLVEIPDCAHCPPIEQPVAFTRLVRAFLVAGEGRRPPGGPSASTRPSSDRAR
ncbi:MAG TPA: alpha/beta fold hydrolase [Candidatus Binatia bacterium]|nr:alpha/beta fold hydrolase [Candidatus Binatia bacterium]